MNRRALAAASCPLAFLTLPVPAQAGRVLAGYSVGSNGLETARAAGFECVELGTTEIAALSAADVVVRGISVEASSKEIPTEGPARLRRCVAP
jgi:hypothetical protein